MDNDYAKAVEWYTKAAEQRYCYGQNNLGRCYEKGHGVMRSIVKAKRMYALAKAQGHEAAQRSLERLGVP